MAPSLGLSYSSQGGGGMAGVGWSLSGFSSIHRCPANYFVDDAKSAVSYTSADKFCLDGQRLIPLGDGTYRTERDSFSRITPSPNATSPTSWTVESKSGLTMMYATSEAGAGADASWIRPGGAVRVWAVNKVKDRKGNYYSIDYQIDTVGPEQVSQRPISISYAGNTIEFGYEANMDVEQVAMFDSGGAMSKNAWRLKSITTKVGGSTVRKYTLGYTQSQSSARSMLTSLQECGYYESGSTLCLPATVITMTQPVSGEGSLTLQGTADDFTTTAPTNNFTTVVDLNGDGKSDLVRYKGEVNGVPTWGVRLGGTGAEQAWPTAAGITNNRILWGDFNGDGKTDFVREGNGVWHRCLSTGSGFSCSVVTLPAPPSDANIYNQASGDFDGDGRIDIAVYQGHDSNVSKWTICLASDAGFNCTAQVYGPTERNDTPGLSNMMIADFNGDGRADIAGYGLGTNYSDRWQVAFSNFSTNSAGTVTSSGFILGPGQTIATKQWAYKSVVADFNGDGMADLIAGYNDAGVGHPTDWQVCLSTGTGTFNCSWWAGRVENREQGLLGDFNGDGRTDIAQWTGSYWQVCLSAGYRLVCNPWGSAVPEDQGNWDHGNMTGDFDGNGKTDIAIITRNPDVWKIIGSQTPIRDMVSKVTDGLGKEANFFYEPLTTTGSYTKGSGAVFPALDIQSPMYVVTSMNTQDGIGGFRSFSYSYSGLRGHSKGAGLLGFAERKVTDNYTNRVTTTQYYQDYANRIAGAPQTVEVARVIGGTTNLLSRTSSSFHTRSVAGSGATIYQVFPAQSTSESYDPLYSAGAPFSVTSSTTALVDIDAYGNVLKSTVDNGTTSKVTTTTYDIDTTTNNWLTGRPATVKVETTHAGQMLKRESSFSYLSGTTLVSLETIEQNLGGEEQLITEHDYDSVGNRKETRVSGTGISNGAATPGCVMVTGGGACRKATVSYTTDSRFPSGATNAAGHSSSMTYNGRIGAVETSTNPNGRVARAKYDALGRKIWSYDPMGVNSSVTYAAGTIANAVMAITSSASGSPTAISHIDILGREIRRDVAGADGVNNSVKTTYDHRGRKVLSSRPYPTSGTMQQYTLFDYDDYLDRMIQETAPDGGITKIEPSGFTTVVRRYPGSNTTLNNPEEQKSTKVTNSEGWTTSVTDAINNVTTYTYNAHGNLLSVNKPGQTATVMTYDIRGRKKSLVDPDAGSIYYTYNAAGDLTNESVTGGRNVDTTFDMLGRASVRTETVTSVGVAKTYVTTFTYDSALIGALSSEKQETTIGAAAKVTTTRDWSFDAYTRPSIAKVTISDPAIPGGARVFSSATGYDANSRVVTTIYPVTNAVMGFVRSNGYLTTATFNGAYIWQASERYADQQLKKAFVGGYDSASAAFTLNKTYDSAGRVASHVAVKGATNLQGASFGFDRLGNLISRSDPVIGQNDTYCYDAINRLKGTGTQAACTQTHGYDNFGNIARSGFVYAPTNNNRLVSINGTALNYDYAGNVTSDGVRQFSYSPFDVPDKIIKAADWMEYSFTGDHQRVYERRGNGAGASGITFYASPGFFEQDEDIAGGVYSVKEYRYYLNTPEGNVGIAITTPGSSTPRISYFLKDHLGSNVGTVSPAGVIESRSAFDAWGVRTVSVGAADDRGFTGHEHIGFGLIHMNGRVYDPLWGRFLQADPIIQNPWDLQNYNRYSYVGNNPLSFTDPTGFF